MVFQINFKISLVTFKSNYKKKILWKETLKKKLIIIFTLMIVGGSQGAQIFDEIIHNIIIKVSKTNPLKSNTSNKSK